MRGVVLGMDYSNIKGEYLNGVYSELANLLGIEVVLKIHNTYRGQQVTLIDRTIKNNYEYEAVAQNLFDYVVDCTICFQVYVYDYFKYALLADSRNLSLYNMYVDFNKDIKDYVLDLENGEHILEVIEELPASMYFNQVYAQMQSYLEKASRIKEDVDNYQGGFVGGGFGIGGALKGILMAGVANAVAETAYSIHQYKKIDVDKINDYLNEFLKTEHSKAFILELMVLDIKYMFMKSLDVTNELEKVLENRDIEDKKLFNRSLGLQWYTDLFRRYVKSASVILVTEKVIYG